MKIPSELISASERGFLVSPEYFNWGILNAINGVYLTSETLDLLKIIENKFPKNIRFLLWDGYRPKEVQEYLFDELYKVRKKEFPEYNHEEIRKLVKIFVAEPNDNAPHLTGKTIDLTLFDINQDKTLEMYGDFDEFTERSSVNYFKDNPPQTSQQKDGEKNRHYLAEIMKKHGFKMIESEWWHFQLF